jgi:hypothetical protein
MRCHRVRLSLAWNEKPLCSCEHSGEKHPFQIGAGLEAELQSELDDARRTQVKDTRAGPYAVGVML